MSDYTKTTNFSAKDALTSGDPNKLILGSLFDTEFDALATSVATKADKLTSVTTTNNLFKTNASGNLVEATSISDDGAEVSITTGRTLNVVDNSGLKVAGTAITSTAAELNLLDGVTATTAEINKLAGSSSGTVLTTGDEGSGNGIDADTVDGIQGASLLRADTSDSHTSGTLTLAATTNLSGTWQVGGTAVNSTAAELNELDASAAAVSNYVSGIRTYFYDGENSASGLDIDGLIGSTWESVGPTGSSATNIWTPMDDIPSGAVGVIIRIVNQIIGGTNTSSYSSIVYAQETGTGGTPGGHNVISYAQFTNTSGSTERGSDVSEVIVPLDGSLRFDLAYASSGTTPSPAVTAYLVGFIA